MTSRIRMQSTETLSDDWGRLTRYTFGFQRADGTWQTHKREIYDHGHAAAVLLHDPARDTVALVRQFRIVGHVHGNEAWLLECCAGLLDGDDPATCARKEAKEEAGIDMLDLQFVTDCYASPGSYSERVACFTGTYEGPARTGFFGLEEEGEEIELVELPFDDAFAMIATGAIVDAKTILLLQHLALNRPAR